MSAHIEGMGKVRKTKSSLISFLVTYIERKCKVRKTKPSLTRPSILCVTHQMIGRMLPMPDTLTHRQQNIGLLSFSPV